MTHATQGYNCLYDNYAYLVRVAFLLLAYFHVTYSIFCLKNKIKYSTEKNV